MLFLCVALCGTVPFMAQKGADISWMTQIEASGYSWKDAYGQQADLLDINNGMLWSDGRAEDNMRNYSRLVTAGHNAVKAPTKETFNSSAEHHDCPVPG